MEHSKETNWNKLLDEAVRMWPNDIQTSIAQLRVLTTVSDSQFTFRPRAIQYLGIALFNTGQYDQAKNLFEQLISDWTQPTSFRRENLCYAGQVALVLGQYDQARGYITDAKRLATESFDVITHGKLRQMESIVTAKQGQSDKALEEMISGRRMVQVHRTFQEVAASNQNVRSLVTT